jgi:hypothetical protein
VAFSFDRPVEATRMTVRAVPPQGEFALYGGAVVSSDGAIQQLFGRSKTKYHQVYADGEIRVLENTAALSRAFLVPRARVAPSLGAALSVMVHQPFQPDQEVILANDATTQATPIVPEPGGQGAATITTYSPGDVTVHTSASADAWLVLSDTYYPGWVASIDGQPAPVLRGDVLFRVVQVPVGEHDVELRFEPTSVKLGLLISLIVLALLASVFVLAGRRARRSRTTSQ